MDDDNQVFGLIVFGSIDRTTGYRLILGPALAQLDLVEADAGIRLDLCREKTRVRVTRLLYGNAKTPRVVDRHELLLCTSDSIVV